MNIWTITLLMWQVASLVAFELCDDQSKDIVKGRIQCQENTNSYEDIKLYCAITCNPGYNPYPISSVNCNSNGRQYWRYDSNGRGVELFPGSWTNYLNQVECRAPTSCPPVSQPLYGSVTCTKENSITTCLRNCQYPYEATEPEILKEECGPDTNFFWTHTLRNNVSTVPPCLRN